MKYRDHKLVEIEKSNISNFDLNKCSNCGLIFLTGGCNYIFSFNNGLSLSEWNDIMDGKISCNEILLKRVL
jgi:hypothetical protein